MLTFYYYWTSFGNWAIPYLKQILAIKFETESKNSHFYLMNLFIIPNVIRDEALSIKEGLMHINLSIYSKYFKGSY